MKQFKGAQCTMRQGSARRDDYLVRKLPGGRWTRLTIKTQADLEAMKIILASIERVHWHQCARYVQEHPNVPTMAMAEFVK